MQKLALLSDVHGNVVALDAVLAQLARQGIDRVVCLGDVALFGPQPVAALTRLRALRCPIVMGNTDARAINPVRSDASNDDEPRDADSVRISEIEQWGASQLTGEDRAFIDTFRPRVEITLDGYSLLAFHGSPNSFLDIVTATTPDEEIARCYAGHHADIMAGGHTHAQLLRRYRDAFIINPGSVGLPYEKLADSDGIRNPSWAEYAIINIGDGTIQIELCRVAYDLELLVDAVQQSGMPHAEWWLSDWA